MASPNLLNESVTPEALAAVHRQIPPAAHVLAHLQRLLADPNSELEQIAELIHVDPAMAARVIHISNSAWFGRSGSCETVFDAVRQIGFREVYQIVAIFGSAAILSRPAPAYRRDAMTLWREAVSCAIGAELLAERAGEDTVAAYLSGLFHGIGRIAISQHLSAAGPSAARELTDEGFPMDFSGTEFALLGFSQAAVAAALLRAWKFPEGVVEPVRLQYEPLEAEEPHDRLAAALYGGRLLRTVLCRKAEVAPLPADEEIFALLRLGREEVLGFVPALQERMARVQRMTRV